MKYLDTYLIVSMDFGGEYEYHGSYVDEQQAFVVVDALSEDDTYKDVWIEDVTVVLG